MYFVTLFLVNTWERNYRRYPGSMQKIFGLFFALIRLFRHLNFRLNSFFDDFLRNFVGAKFF